MDILYYKCMYDLLTHICKDEITPLHAHEGVEIIYYRKGNGTTTVDEEEFPCCEGNVLIIFPNTVHAHKNQPDCEMLINIFPCDMVKEYRKIFNDMSPVSPFVASPPEYVTFLFEVLHERRKEFGINTKRGFLIAAVSLLLEKLPLSDKKISNVNIGKIIDFCNNHFRENIDADYVSENLGISKSHISHTFSNVMKTNFRDYINNLRIRVASELLQTEKMSITDIAYESGFESIRTFNRAFLKVHGVTPSEYKKTVGFGGSDEPF